MNSEEGPSRRNSNSSKKEERIKFQIKTEKSLHVSGMFKRKNNSNSVNPYQLSPLGELNKKITPQNRKSQITKLQWRLGKTETTSVRSGVLPDIAEHRAVSGCVHRDSYKCTEPTRSMKIQFKELIPIKEVSKEDRLENYRRIRDQFREVVNASNYLSVSNKDAVFRAYIQKGNNGILIKELMKKRWWWHLVDQPEKANLVWTEWFNRGATAQMPEERGNRAHSSHYSPQEEGDEPRVTSVRKILDESTFCRIKPRISLREQHYLRSKFQQNLSQDQLKQKESVITDVIHNHIDGCLQLHSKKLLFKNLYEYLLKYLKPQSSKRVDPFQYIPLTYYIDDEQSPSLFELYGHCDLLEGEESMNMWIVKPGENSNRGYGITVHAGKESLKKQIETRLREGRSSMIVQKYMEDCFLIEGRKFDIRCYILVTTVNGMLKGYWYEDGYIRTSSTEYSLEDVDNLMIHLTNDAVQKNHQSYGKFQDFNKVSFEGFRRYLKRTGSNPDSFNQAYSKMKNIAHDLISSACAKIKRKQYTFELFGLDFMLDQQMKPFLIEANSNPCLDNSGVILGKLIYQLIDNVLMTAVDPLFPAPRKGRFKQQLSKDYFRSNKFELIYSDSTA